MLIIFKSAASGNVITLQKNGKEMLAVLNKDREDARGIITVAQLPDAIVGSPIHHAAAHRPAHRSPLPPLRRRAANP